MGLDLALGALILVMAIRGFFRGFLLQTIRLAGVVACVYAADPLRDQIKPRVAVHLPTIQPELVDRMLWWTSAVVSYVVMVGLATLAVKIYRRQPYGLAEKNRGDQVFGSLLGMAKGAIVAAFLVAAIDRYALVHLKGLKWAEEQAHTSQAMAWNERFRPAEKIWSSPPVQHFREHIKRMGLDKLPQAPKDTAPVQTASNTPNLPLETSHAASSDEKHADAEVAKAVEDIQNELRKVEEPK